MIRLAKFIADAGCCSRRQASRLIDSDRVLVNNRPGLHIDRVTDSDCVTVDGRELKSATAKIYFLYNKPIGVDSICDVGNPASIIHHLPVLNGNMRVFPVGRLDKDSHGLMLLTNHGELCQTLLHPDYYHEKEYLVTVDKPVTEAFLLSMAAGVSYGDVTTKPCRIGKAASHAFRIILTQGLNRQIRRMCQALGYRVMDLQRIRMVNLLLDGIEPNQHRWLLDEEISGLLRATGHQ
ncbi:pseudouridine synthase [Endozoicomonas sp. SESOKO1]|uniref:pseudouridine synthase n=1 Tax=Endozoicomonas sp. SESOKO1 TaxID=2828742 RepID=UPI002147CCB8|nr:RNA pseudouridine synthase [Endozoicomonas sp. SESOKO1]